jgi:hypothetical protein
LFIYVALFLAPESGSSFFLATFLHYCAQASHIPLQDQQQKMAAIQYCQKTFKVSEHCFALCICILSFLRHTQVGDPDNMHTEGEQKYCISHILQNIKARPPTSPFLGLGICFSLLSACSLVQLSTCVSIPQFFCFFGARHYTITVEHVGMHEPYDVSLRQYDSQRPV